MRIPLEHLDRVLLGAERRIALLDRCRPLNAAHERARLLAAWQRGQPESPAYEYGAPPGLSVVRAELERLAEVLERGDARACLYAERTRELALEAALAELIGRPEIKTLAPRRYDFTPAELETARRSADSFLQTTLSVEGPEVLRHRSDDASDPRSLRACLSRRIGELKLPLAVEVRDDLASAAAVTADGRVLVRAGAWHSELEVERIVLHEIEGHARPRVNAAAMASGLFRVGTAQGSDDEEGRSVLLEQRAGLLGAERRRELGLRHRAALAVRAGADFPSTVRLLRADGATLERALEVAARVHRGGGLAREVVYLAAFCRVQTALEARPELEWWLERGRISVRAASLSALGELPEALEIDG